MRSIKFIGTFGMAAILAVLMMLAGCEKNVAVSGITISSTAETLEIGSTVQLSYDWQPSNATIEGAIWSSSAQAVATVDQNGVVTGVAAGTANITVTVNGQKTATCAVTVLPQMTGIKLSSNSVTIKVDSIKQLTYTVEPKDAKVYKEEWSSSNDDVVFVDSYGFIDAFAAGTAVITLKVNGQFTDACRVTVEKNIPPMTSIKISSEAETINVSSTVTLSYTVEPSEAKVESAVWSSSAETVATVDQDGVVKGIGAGTATITITVNGKFTKTCAVTVIPEGALPGIFSVSADKKVYFSKGNLQATCTAGGAEGTSTYSWIFAEHQYDYVGNAAGNTTIDTQTQNSKVDLFGWVGKSGTLTEDATKYGISTSTTDAHYGNNTSDALKADWGTAIDNKGTWSTLSMDEWAYLLGSLGRTDANRFAKANVSDIKGLIIFPDGYTGTTSGDGIATVNTPDVAFPKSPIADATWSTMESAGCVFLPAAGDRCGSNVGSGVGSDGCYWSSTPGGAYGAYFLYFGSDSIRSASDSRYYGGSVRLVCSVSK